MEVEPLDQTQLEDLGNHNLSLSHRKVHSFYEPEPQPKALPKFPSLENSLIYKEKTKKLYDSKIKNHIFNVGDRVLLFNSRLKIFSGKLKTRWSRHFTITKVFPYGTVELSQPDGPNIKVNSHSVKHYFGGDIPQLVVPDLQTFPMDKLMRGSSQANVTRPQVVSAAKLPILNPNKFDLWKMRIEQYFLMTDYSLWEVILNGDSHVPTRIVEGVVQPVAPTTTE
nr:reverse transcriptase domain-containing protein [Tanacetum cinerariifolium]